jgi:hypothetical protein
LLSRQSIVNPEEEVPLPLSSFARNGLEKNPVLPVIDELRVVLGA